MHHSGDAAASVPPRSSAPLAALPCGGNRFRTCLFPTGVLEVGIPLPNVLDIPLLKVDIQILAVSVHRAVSPQGTSVGH